MLDRGIQDVAGFATGAAHEHVAHTFGGVLRGRARTLRRFVVGVRVHLQEHEPFRRFGPHELVALLALGLLRTGHDVGGYRTSSRRQSLVTRRIHPGRGHFRT